MRRLQGEIGAHDGLPVETMAVSSETSGKYLLTCSEGGEVKAWDVHALNDTEDDGNTDGLSEGATAEEEGRRQGKRRRKRSLQGTQSAAVSQFFEHLEQPADDDEG